MTQMSLEMSKTHPDIKIKILICDRFDVEADCRYRSNNLTNL